MSQVAAFKRCLPALHQMARFPDADLSYVCRKRCLEVNDVMHTMRQALEDSGCDVWDLPALRISAGRYDVTITEQGVAAAEPSGPVRSETSRKFVSLAPAVIARRAPVVVKQEVVTDGYLETPGRKSREKEYLQVCRLLLDNPELSEGAACKATGIAQGVFGYFKKKHFGLGKISPDKLRDVLGLDKAPEAPRPAVETHVEITQEHVREVAPAIEAIVRKAPASPRFDSEKVREYLRELALVLAKLAGAIGGSK